MTLAQINDLGLDRVAWNDQKPNNQTSSSKAHSKGIIAYSELSATGFYIDHSIPKYPAFLDDHSVNITIPKAEQIYGQHIACFSLSLEELNDIAQQLAIIKPFIYEVQMPLRAGNEHIHDMASGNTPVNKELFKFYQTKT